MVWCPQRRQAKVIVVVVRRFSKVFSEPQSSRKVGYAFINFVLVSLLVKIISPFGRTSVSLGHTERGISTKDVLRFVVSLFACTLIGSFLLCSEAVAGLIVVLPMEFTLRITLLAPLVPAFGSVLLVVSVRTNRIECTLALPPTGTHTRNKYLFCALRHWLRVCVFNRLASRKKKEQEEKEGWRRAAN